MSKPLLALALLAGACLSDRGPDRSPSSPSARAENAASGLPSAVLTPLTGAAPSAASAAVTVTAPAAPVANSMPASNPAAARQRVLVLGDSLSDPRSHGGGYLEAISSCPGVRIENLARGGYMVNQMRRRFEAEALPRLRSFDALIVFGGVNDLYSDETAKRTVEKISADLTSIYESAKAAKLRVIALTVAPWGGFHRWYNERRAASTARLNAWLRAERDAGRIDVLIETEPLLSCGDRELLCPELAAPFKDGLHFGKGGHERLGRALREQAFPSCVR